MQPSAKPRKARALSTNRIFMISRSLFCRSEAEIIEGGNAVGLRPQAYRTRTLDVVVLHIDIRLAVQRDADALGGELDAQDMPYLRRHGSVNVFDRDAFSALRVVE